MAKYPSKYTDKEVTAANHIVEKLSENRASMIGVILPIAFWKDPVWEGWYKSQIFQTNKILKSVSVQSLRKAILQTNATSIRTNRMLALARKLERELAAESRKEVKEVDIVRDSVGRFSSKSNIPEDL